MVSMKKQRQPEPLALEVLRGERIKLRISFAANVILFLAVILAIIFS